MACCPASASIQSTSPPPRCFNCPPGRSRSCSDPSSGSSSSTAQNPATGVGTSTTQNGIVVGVNTGVFVPVSAATSMGVLLAFELRRTYEVCYNDAIGGEYCMSVTGSDFVSLVGLTAAVLF